MDVWIGEMVSTVTAVDGDALLSPQVLAKIVRVVLQAVQDQEAHRRRAWAERRVNGSGPQELEEEEG